MERDQHISLFSYFHKERTLLILTGITGIIYNVGMTAGPWFEGQLAQYLYDILKGTRRGRDIVILSLIYILVITGVQTARAMKRLFVRKFANNVSASMKQSIFHHLVHESSAEIRKEDTGAVMTKAIADAEACAEGMRKFTTEIYDTGVVMIAYLVMLFVIDWRVTLLVIIFPPIAYAVSAALRKRVSATSAESREAMSALNSAAVDSVSNAMTYRIYGEEENRSASYEQILDNYERKNVAAGIWQNSPQPVYYVISMIGVIPILYFGGRNVLGTGWAVWSIASFSSFLSCFTKLATKSSHAAKLFNAVQKAEVSWKRIRDYLTDDGDGAEAPGDAAPAELEMMDAGFSYGDGQFGLRHINFKADPGEIIGVTGKVASGKSTFGRMLLHEYPYSGSILYGGREFSGITECVAAYAGHDPELFTGTVRENIAFSDAIAPGSSEDARLKEVLSEVQIDGEVTPDTSVGMEGTELSGGQRARIALARALYSKAPVLVLDDPFAAVDRDTEQAIFAALREKEQKRIIILISHRMELFPEMDRIAFIGNGTMITGTHPELMQNSDYRTLYELQSREEGGDQNA